MTMAPPQPRERTKYKKPHSLNTVSVFLGLVALALAYVAYALYPVLTLRLRAKSELEDALPRLYHLNLMLPPGLQHKDIVDFKRELVGKLRAAGVKDPQLEVDIQRSKALVALQAKFHAAALFPGIEKTYILELSPQAQTDAARVDW
jgi:hypothetical protein